MVKRTKVRFPNFFVWWLAKSFLPAFAGYLLLEMLINHNKHNTRSFLFGLWVLTISSLLTAAAFYKKRKELFEITQRFKNQ